MSTLRKIGRRWAIAVAAVLSAACGKGYMDLPPRQFHSLITSNKKARLLDVRTAEEYAEEHLNGALNIPITADTAVFLASVDSLSHKTPFAVYCRSGRRSETASRLLAARGYTVYQLEGGIQAWKRWRLPTKGPGADASVEQPDTLGPKWLHGQLQDIH